MTGVCPGARLLGFCKAQQWPTACTDIRATPPFVQAYVQRYPNPDPSPNPNPNPSPNPNPTYLLTTTGT